MRATFHRFTERIQLKTYTRQLGRNLLLHNPGQILVLYRRKSRLHLVMISSWRSVHLRAPKLHDCLSPSPFGVAIAGVGRNRAQDRIVGVALFPTAIERLTIER